MYVIVNGARLFFDVEGAEYVPDGDRMRRKPTLVLVHGGPGFDHSAFKPAFSRLADLAQVVYYDHRGNGRSGGDDPSTWTLAQWGDDVRGLCDALGIERPIVCGVSFGGYVAQSYATRHPEHPAGLILISTLARADFDVIYRMFGELGGPESYAIAKSYWDEPDAEKRIAFRDRCVPLYQQRPFDTAVLRRALVRPETALHFNGPRNEHGRMDFGPALGALRCPVLLMAGDRDPITPIELADELAAAMPTHLLRYERFPGCGHPVQAEDPDRAFATMRAFITSL